MKMHSSSRRRRLEEFEELCRRQGLPLTVQRRTIFEAVLVRQDHPTADQVYNAVRGRLPGVSRTTVYRVLDTLVRMGVINRISHPGAAARFDAKVHQHHHLVCLQCGKIIDLEDQRLNELALPTVATQGYRIDEFHIHFRGTCPACLKKQKTKTGKKETKGAQARASKTKKTGKRLSKKRRPSS